MVIKSQDYFLPNKLYVGPLLLMLVQQLNIRAVGWCLCDSLFSKGFKKTNQFYWNVIYIPESSPIASIQFIAL